MDCFRGQRRTAAAIAKIVALVVALVVALDGCARPRQRRAIVTDVEGVEHIALSGNDLHWVSLRLDDPHETPRDANVLKRFGGGSPEDVRAAGSGAITAYAVAGNEAFVVVDSSVIESVPRRGGALRWRHVPEGTTSSGLAVDDTRLYFGTREDVGTVRSVARRGGASKVVAKLAGTRDVDRLVREGSDLVAATSTAIGAGEIVRIAIGSGAVTSLTRTRSCRALAAMSREVFWIDSTYGSDVVGLWRVPIAGGAPVRVADVKSGDHELAISVDERHVYWVDADRFVLRAPVGGGAIERVVSGKDVHAVYRSGTSLFWSEGNQILSMTL